MYKTNTVIVGASAAGLACAAHLSKRNIDYKIFEKHEYVAHAWRNHYDRLHLHTNKSSSELPFAKFPKTTPKYPSKNQVVKYLENYCTTMGIEPAFNTTVNKIFRKEASWITNTDKGSIESKNLIICTGNTNIPKSISKPGLETFPGKKIHSSKYRNGKELKGKRVLVVGFGNSACEIAICLHEHGAFPALSVRSEVNVIPRDIFGIPSLQIGIYQSKFSAKFADILNAPIIKLMVGDIEKYGLKKSKLGPTQQIVKLGRIPLLDIGTMDLVKKGDIKVFGDITKIEKEQVSFEKDLVEEFDAIIMAVGYETGIKQFLDITPEREKDIKMDIKKRKLFGHENMYFCG